MNKRDLIKALFKDPTIKALYESGHFNATDINRAILTEANDEENEAYLKELIAQLKKMKADHQALAKKVKQIQTENPKDAKPFVRERNALLKKIGELEQQIQKLTNKDVSITKAAAKTPPPEDDKVAGDATASFADALEKLKSSFQTRTAELSNDNVDQELDQYSQDVEKTIAAVKPEIEKELAAVQQAKGQQKQVPDTKGWDRPKVSIRGAINRNELTLDQIKESLKTVEAFQDLFKIDTKKVNPSAAFQQAEDLFNEGWVAQELERLREIAEEATDVKQMIVPLENAGNTVMSFYDFLKEKDKQGKKIIVPQELLPKGPAPASKEDFEKEFIVPIEQAMGSTDKTAGKAGLKEEQYIELFTINAANSDALKSITDRDLQVFGGWFIMSKQAGVLQEARTPTRQTEFDLEPLQYLMEKHGRFTDFWDSEKGPEFVSEGIKNSIKKRSRPTVLKSDKNLKTTLAGIQALIDSGQIEIPDSITIGTDSKAEPQTDKAKLLAVQQQQKEALEQQADVNQDKDLSSMEQEELDASWKGDLDIFFGKNAESSSFMNQLLLRKQSDMLYSMIQTLTQIIVGNRKPKTGGGVEAASLTDQGNEEEDNQPETQDTPAPAPEPELQQSTGTPPGKRDDVLEEQVVNEIFDKLFGGKKDKDETVQLSRESTKNMRQHLEAMVTLLRSLKVDISDYSQFSTRESSDPRFDGSSLKKALDAKLAVVQKRIGMLAKQIEIATLDQDNQIEKDAEQLATDMTEVLDLLSEDSKSERRLKVQKVREVYNEMRRMYIEGLMTSLENKQVRQAKEGAQQIKDYILNEKEFLSYFPQGMVVGTSVMTLSEAESSMKQIIKKFIDTIRDIVTITKSQEVSSSDLGTAAKDLVQIADRIEALFKVPSEIDEEFMKKYLEAAANNPKSAPLSDKKPSLEDDMLGFVKNWFSDKIGDLANAGLEYLMKLLANGFKGKNISPEDREQIMEYVVEIQEWIDTLEENQKTAVESLVDFLIRNTDRRNLKQIFAPAVVSEAISEEERNSIKGFTDKFQKDLEGKILKFLNEAEEGTKATLIDLMIKQSDEFIKHLSLTFKIKQQLGDDVAKEASNPSTEPNIDEPDAAVDDGVDPKKIGKSEEQMKKLIGFLKENSKTKQQMTKLQTEIKKHFREETDLRVSESESDMALYLFVYYVYHQTGNLKENIEVTANPRNKINKFTDYMKKSQFLTKDLKDFISQNVSKISKFLLSKVAKDILNDTDSPVMITLGNLLPKNPDLKRTVDKLNQGLEKGSDPSPAPKQDGDESAAADEENPEQTPAGDDDDTAAEEEGDPLDRHVKRIRKDIAEYERKAGTGEAKAIMEDFLSQEDAKKLGKDSIEALYSIIEIAKIIVNNFSGEPEEVSESVSKIFNKIKKSANAFMQNQKARSNFSEFEGEFRAHLGHQSEKAKPYLMYLLKFMNGAELAELLKLLYDHNGDITEAREEMKGLHTPSSTDSDVDNLEEALKPIIATMLKEHYNH